MTTQVIYKKRVGDDTFGGLQVFVVLQLDPTATRRLDRNVRVVIKRFDDDGVEKGDPLPLMRADAQALALHDFFSRRPKVNQRVGHTDIYVTRHEVSQKKMSEQV